MAKLMIRSMITLVLALALLPGCRQKQTERPTAGGKLSVVTTLFPVYEFTRNVGGNRVAVTLLVPPGADAHSFDPKPGDAVSVANAALFIYTSAFMEPWAARFVDSIRRPTLMVVDGSSGVSLQKESDGHGGDDHDHERGIHHHEGGLDPHIWLDFANARIMVDTIAAALAARDPEGKAVYTANAEAYKRELQKLDDVYRAALANCQSTTVLHGGHYAFGYLTRRYGLHYESASAVSGDAEPTAEKLIRLAGQLRSSKQKYIFTSELISPKVAEILARDSGAEILSLHAAHNISKDDFARGVTFTDLMQKNLVSLRTGLGCR